MIGDIIKIGDYTYRVIVNPQPLTSPPNALCLTLTKESIDRINHLKGLSNV